MSPQSKRAFHSAMFFGVVAVVFAAVWLVNGSQFAPLVASVAVACCAIACSIWLRYERMIGWRYIYMAGRSPIAKLTLVVSLLVCGVGLFCLYKLNVDSGWVVALTCISSLAAAVAACLCVLSVFSTVAVLGVILSVGTLTVVLAVATGFQEVFRDKVLGVNAHVIVTHQGFVDYEEEERRIVEMHPDIVASQPFIYVEMLATRGKGKISGVAIKGVIPEKVEKVLDLGKHMIAGEVASLAANPTRKHPSMIVGRGLAQKLDAKVGDEISLVAQLSQEVGNMSSGPPRPTTKKFIVTGLFYSGFEEYDARLVYVHLDEAKLLWGQPDQVLGVELKVRNVAEASKVARVIENQLPLVDDDTPDRFGFKIQDWHELNHTLFSALTFQKIIMLVLLMLIIFVAMFNLASSLLMMVVEKTPEVSILKAMGAESKSVAVIFSFLGFCIGCIGTFFGVGLGVFNAYVLSHHGYDLDPEVYLIDRLPVVIQWQEIALVIVGAMLVCGVATILPSLRAAALHPAVGIRRDHS